MPNYTFRITSKDENGNKTFRSVVISHDLEGLYLDDMPGLRLLSVALGDKYLQELRGFRFEEWIEQLHEEYVVDVRDGRGYVAPDQLTTMFEELDQILSRLTACFDQVECLHKEGIPQNLADRLDNEFLYNTEKCYLLRELGSMEDNLKQIVEALNKERPELIFVNTTAGPIVLKKAGKGSCVMQLGIKAEEDEDPALDALESLVLAHACEGIDVTSPEYVRGINTTLDAIANHE